jgi:hypothetical protein
LKNASNPLAAQNTDRLDYGPDLLRSGLADISWFFPEGFEKVKTINNPHWKEFQGREFSYKFFQSKGPLSVNEKWQLAREELRFGRIYAPNVYLGLRLLRLDAGVPEWVSFKPSSFILNKKAPQDIFDLAIVTRRGLAHKALNGYLMESSKSIDLERLADRIVSTLIEAHCRVKQQSGDLSGMSLSRYIDSVFEVPAERSTNESVLSSFRESAEDRLFDLLERYRLISGCREFVNSTRTHGNLLVENVVIAGKSRSPQFQNVEVLGPSLRQNAHPYLDMATLVIDLFSHGLYDLAELIERALQRNMDDEQILLYELFKQAESIYWSTMSADSANDLLEAPKSYLSTLFKIAFNINSPGLILLKTDDEELGQRLSSLLTQLSYESDIIQLSGSNHSTERGVTIFLSNTGSSFDKQLLVERALEKSLPILELLITRSEGGPAPIKIWPPVSSTGVSSAIILPSSDFDERTLSEIFRNFSRLSCITRSQTTCHPALDGHNEQWRSVCSRHEM